MFYSIFSINNRFVFSHPASGNNLSLLVKMCIYWTSQFYSVYTFLVGSIVTPDMFYTFLLCSVVSSDCSYTFLVCSIVGPDSSDAKLVPRNEVPQNHWQFNGTDPQRFLPNCLSCIYWNCLHTDVF
jgi:hypothetical protein